MSNPIVNWNSVRDDCFVVRCICILLKMCCLSNLNVGTFFKHDWATYHIRHKYRVVKTNVATGEKYKCVHFIQSVEYVIQVWFWYRCDFDTRVIFWYRCDILIQVWFWYRCDFVMYRTQSSVGECKERELRKWAFSHQHRLLHVHISQHNRAFKQQWWSASRQTGTAANLQSEIFGRLRFKTPCVYTFVAWHRAWTRLWYLRTRIYSLQHCRPALTQQSCFRQVILLLRMWHEVCVRVQSVGPRPDTFQHASVFLLHLRW